MQLPRAPATPTGSSGSGGVQQDSLAWRRPALRRQAGQVAAGGKVTPGHKTSSSRAEAKAVVS
jgi:hypothetical protein